ncbi:MAG TPA: hypothetical protein VK249_03680 [Anaerolineales bacterium]|nr:hypothetical protein [Anaerolineales bacterium]
MRRPNLLWLLLFLLLAACSSLNKATAATPTPNVSSGKFDGRWEGNGKTAEGIPVTIFFTVQDSTVTSTYYQFVKPGFASCYDTTHQVLNAPDQPHIINGAFTASFGRDFDLSASFKNDSSASGHLKGTLITRRPECNFTFEIDWTATKQVAATPPPASAPVSRQLPLETLAQILVFGLSNGAVLALNAIGVTIIYSTVRTLNLAHGDVFALATVVVTSTINGFGIQRNLPALQLIGILLLVFLAAIAAGALLSMGVDQFGFKPFRGHSRLAPLIATLGLSFILFQGALVWRTFQHSWIPGEHRSVPGLPEVPTDGIPSFLPEINLIKALGLPFNVIIRFSDVFVLIMAILFVALATWFLQKTSTGRAIRAISQNQTLAQILGVNVDQTIRRAFAVGGALAGAAAFIFAIYYGRPFGVHGAQSGLLAFAAALLGGIGNPIGALISGLVIGAFSSLSDYYLSAQWTSVLTLILLIGLLVWRPTGLGTSEEADAAVVRDSVILTAPGKSRVMNRFLIILLALLAIIPIGMQLLGLSGQTLLRTIDVFIILTFGLNLALGMAGLLDFGFALSYGAGAYTVAILSPLIGFLPALISSILLVALIGAIKGGLGWRLRADFLAVATLALGLLGQQIIVNLKPITGGAGGLGNFLPAGFLSLNVITPTQKYFLVYAVMLLAAWASQRLLNSRTGRAWVALSEDEMAATAVGINVNGSRLLAFVISSTFAGLAGALYASTFSFVDPDMLAFHITTLVLTMVILGGAGSVTGAILGAIAIVLFDKIIVSQVADLVALIWPHGLYIGATGAPPDIRGANFFNFGIALYLTVLLRARRKGNRSD